MKNSAENIIKIFEKYFNATYTERWGYYEIWIGDLYIGELNPDCHFEGNVLDIHLGDLTDEEIIKLFNSEIYDIEDYE